MTSPTANLLVPDIAQLLEGGAYRDVREALRVLPAADSAEVIAGLDGPMGALAFRVLPRDEAAEVFSELSPETQESLIGLLGDERSSRVVEEMDPDDRARLLDELPSEIAGQIMHRLRPETRKVTQSILGYKADSIGRLMTPDYVRIRPDWSVREALDHVRRWGANAETVDWVFVIDRAGRLVDDIPIRDLLLADPALAVETLMDSEFVSLVATDDREEAVRAMGRYDRTALPVVDSRGMLVGIVTFDDIADVAEEEFTEDIQKLGGMEALGEPYMSVGFASMIRKRGVWLALLFVMQIGTIGVMGYFGLAEMAVQVAFIPLVISCGGNTGSQAATILVRALSLEEVSPGEWFRVAGRELVTGFGLGVMLGALGFVTVTVANLLGFVETIEPALVGVAVGLSVVVIVTWATMVGSMLPIILRRLGLDPATSSTPLVATLMDVSGLTIYFLIAIAVLGDAG
jgi:magnesium transporter